jgi:DNA-binding GntR family transcriptional regulator
LKIELIHRYRITKLLDGKPTVTIMDFIPVESVPGYTHRVAINNELTNYYLSDLLAPNKRNAMAILEIACKGSKN